ncbi:MAG: SRPBCC family protein [Acidobacteria bacterium]|nr:SRPBCC family protein [Acidobacteriota bacterium]
MNRNTQILLAGAGTAGIAFGLKRVFSKKHINTLPYGYGIKLKKAVTVNRPAAELYQYWRNLKHLPQFVDNTVSVNILDEKHSRWTLHVGAGLQLEWDAEITIDRKNEMIGWRSLDGADIANAGYVRFERATGGRGTVIRVALQYNPPAGRLGAAFAAMLGERPGGLIEEALRKFKQFVETGEIATVDERFPHSGEEVEAASEDSFPASDAPAWTGTTGPSAPRH